MWKLGPARTHPSLVLLCPGLFGGLARWRDDYADSLRFPDLEQLLDRARRTSTFPTDFESALGRLFDVAPQDTDLPAGALTRALFAPVEPGSYWLCASPVHLRADVATLRVVDSSRLAIGQSEAAALAAAFNAHFSDRGMHLIDSSPDLWHLRLDPQRVTTTPLSVAMGHSVLPLLPRGADAPALHALMNETQMLFFDSDVNRRREAEGQPAISGLWLWGAGCLVQRKTNRKFPFVVVATDDVLALGLARWAGAENNMPRPEALEPWLDSLGKGRSLVVLNDALGAAAYDDLHGWSLALQALEDRWFKPLIEALKAGRIERVSLVTGESQFDIGSRGLGTQRGELKPLAHYASIKP